jgi:hypothetical protein
MILIFNLELVQEMDHDLIATEELVSLRSHDLILNLYLGIAPRVRSCDLKTYYVIFHL